MGRSSKSLPSSPLLVKLRRTHFLHPLPASGASASDRMAAKATSPICAKKKLQGYANCMFQKKIDTYYTLD